MRVLAVLCASAVAVQGCVPDGKVGPAPSADWRLVRVSDEQKPVWMSPDTVDSLIRQEVGFRDVTERDALSFRPLVESARNANATSAYPSQREFQHRSQFDNIMEHAEKDNMLADADAFTAFPDRNHNSDNGVASAQWLFDKAVEYAAPCGASVDYFEHSFRQPSVIISLPGTAGRGETVVWGAHQDSISMFGDAPGYDDDASGCVAVLEGFRAACASGTSFARDIEFQFYAGEERGLLGSNDIASQYARDGVNVVGMFQNDMNCFNPVDGPDYNVMGLIEDFTNANLNDFLRGVVSEYTMAGLKGGRCGYGCSDHASWTAAGFPATYAFEKPFGSHNTRIHTPSDTKDLCDPDWMFEFVKLGVGFLVELAN